MCNDTMATISQRNTGSIWDKRARYIEQSTSALQRYVEIGDTAARHTKMKEYTPEQAREADLSIYSRLLSDEQKTRPGRMPERSSGTALTSESAGWGRKHLAISGVSHQPLVQTAHHASAIGPGGSGGQDNGGGLVHSGELFQTINQQDTSGPSSSVQTGFGNPLLQADPYQATIPVTDPNGTISPNTLHGPGKKSGRKNKGKDTREKYSPSPLKNKKR